MSKTEVKEKQLTPEKKFKAGSVSATIWKNVGTGRNGESSDYFSISIDRSYQDKNKKWQNTNSLRVNDLPKARLVLSKAYEYLVLNKQKGE